MIENTRSKRMQQMFADFEKGIQFHAISFREIDAKAKYWLTVALPSMFGLIGYGFQQGQELSTYLAVVFSSVSVCLFASIYFFARTLGSEEVKAGIARPKRPDFKDLCYFLEDSDKWSEYEETKVETALAALDSNEICNLRKSKRLKRAESLLFLGVPCSAFLAVCLTFAYGSIAHRGWATAPISVAVGITVGAFVSTVLLIVAHRRS